MFTITDIKKFIVAYGKKVLFPSFENKLTSTIVLSGIGVIVTPAPLRVLFYNWLIDIFNLNSGISISIPEISAGSADYGYGLLLIFLGLCFNIARYAFDFIQSERTLVFKRKSRINLLKETRSILSISELTNKQFRHSLEYSRIKAYLSDRAIKAIEGEHTKSPGSNEIIIIVDGETRNSGVNPFKNIVLDEISSLENEWSLI